MAAKVVNVTVGSTAELREEMAKWTAKGYVVTSQSNEMATLEYRVRWNMLLLIFLLVLCLIPGFIYLLVVGSRAGRQVIISVVPSADSSASVGDESTS